MVRLPTQTNVIEEVPPVIREETNTSVFNQPEESASPSGIAEEACQTNTEESTVERRSTNQETSSEEEDIDNARGRYELRKTQGRNYRDARKYTPQRRADLLRLV